MEKKSNLILIISIVTGILLAILVGILIFFNLPAQRIRRMLKTANKYIAEENYDEAILTLQKMLEIDPKNEDLYFLLADTYEKNGEIDKELEFIQEVVGMMPENEIISEKFTGWWDIDGNRYYFDENGELLKNQWIDDTYYVGEYGSMLKDRWIDDTYYVDKNGARLVDTATPDGKKVGKDGKRIDDSWKQAYIDVINGGPLWEDGTSLYSGGPDEESFWNYAFVNEDEIPEIFCRIPNYSGFLLSYFHGDVKGLGGGRGSGFEIKAGQNLIYEHSHPWSASTSTAYTIDSDDFTYIINIEEDHPSHEDKQYYWVDGNEATLEQYNAAEAQYFSDPDMEPLEEKYTRDEIIDIINNM